MLPSTGFWIPGVNSPTEEELEAQTDFYSNCFLDPESCADELSQRCSEYNRTDISNPILSDLCGCYMDESQYKIERECDSVCTKIETIPYVLDGIERVCQRDVCIIDGVVLDLNNANTGDVTIRQICQSCSGTNACLCYIGDVNIIGDKLSNINIEQDCGDTICSDNLGNDVDCAFVTRSGQQFDSEGNLIISERVRNVTYTLLALSIIGIILTIIFAFM